jgi:hypothetical protein
MLLAGGAWTMTQGDAAGPRTFCIDAAAPEEPAGEGSGVTVQIEPSAREDVISLLCWSGGAPLEQALRSARPNLQRRMDRRGGSLAIEVWYSSQRLARCRVPLEGAHRIELARHSGVRLCPGSFRLHIAESSPAPNLRAVVLVSARARTRLEDSAGAWLPAPDAALELQPRAAELLSLRRALFG